MQPAVTKVLTSTVRRVTSVSATAPGFLIQPPARRTLQNITAPPAPTPEGLALLKSRRLISVAGPDSATFLQGLITGNLYEGPAQNQTVITAPGLYTAFLTAQGRLRNDVFIYRDTANFARRTSPSPSSAFLIEVDTTHTKGLSDLLRRHKLRSRIQIRLLEEDEVSIHAYWSPSPSPFLSLPSLPPQTIHLPDLRAGGSLGHRILTPTPLIPTVPEQSYHLHRYLHGIPEGQAELPSETSLPLESNLDTSSSAAIDFHKGCYVGQELTIRTRHRGVVRKRVLPVVVYPVGGESPPRNLDSEVYNPEILSGVETSQIPFGENITFVNKASRTAPGRWIRGVGNVGLALVRLEKMTDLRWTGTGTGTGAEGGAGEVVDEKRDEFRVVTEGGQELRVKAFVPGWLREALPREEWTSVGEGRAQ